MPEQKNPSWMGHHKVLWLCMTMMQLYLLMALWPGNRRYCLCNYEKGALNVESNCSGKDFIDAAKYVLVELAMTSNSCFLS